VRTKLSIKVGILVSYDYYFVFDCIRQLYSSADVIVLAIDRDRRTWSGQSFALPETFVADVRAMDPEDKIRFFEDSFYLPGLSPIECDTRERNLLAKQMGRGGWHVQIDSDEYFVDFPRFVAFLHGLSSCSRGHHTVYARWFTLFRKTKNGYLHVRDSQEEFPVATTDPRYTRARIPRGTRSSKVYTDFQVVHESWARNESEILTKLKNWGHTDDFSVEEYFEFWKRLDEFNYEAATDFHPIRPKTWKRLGLVEGGIAEILEGLRSTSHDEADWRSHVIKEIAAATWWQRLKRWAKGALR